MEDTAMDTQIQATEVAEPTQVESQQPKEELDWSKDKRFSSYAGKADQAVSEMYKALKGYDKTYTPLQMAIKKYGINDHQSLEKTLEEYKSLKDPENDTNKFINYLNPVLSDEKDVQWFKDTVEKKIQEIKYRGLSDNLPPEIKESIIKGQEADKRVQELEQKLEIKEITEKITGSLKEIESFSSENNLEFNKAEFLAYCKEKNVPSHLMMDVFQAKAKPFIINNATKQAEEKLLKNQEANRKGGIVTGNKGVSTAKGKENLMQSLDRVLGIKN